MNEDCYSDQAAVPMINALDNCRAELEKLKAGAREISLALLKAENALQRICSINDQTRCGWALKEVDAAVSTARKLGLLEEEK